jgi:cytochrome b subunit of formate dehydrogenase
MLGGGCAITADLATIEAVREGPIGRTSQFHVLKRTHVIVVVGLAALFVSGLLLFAADLETFVHSRVFWLKMVLLVMLLANGVVMLVAERRVRRGDVRAWRHLHTVAVSSLVLWFVTTLAGAALSNL